MSENHMGYTPLHLLQSVMDTHASAAVTTSIAFAPGEGGEEDLEDLTRGDMPTGVARAEHRGACGSAQSADRLWAGALV